MDTFVIQVEEPSLRRKLFKFRYRVYVEQQGFFPPTADHSNRILADPLDDVSVSFALLDRDEVVGSLRLTLLDAIPDPAPFIAQLSMQPGLSAFGTAAVGLSSRFMFDTTKPFSGKGMFRLMMRGYLYGKQHGCRITYGNCSRQLLTFYEHMGYRTYTGAFSDPVYGEKLPILLILGDRSRFVQLRSPLARCAAHYPEDRDAVLWFDNTYARPINLEPADSRLPAERMSRSSVRRDVAEQGATADGSRDPGISEFTGSQSGRRS
jgi:hypothetical protein